MRIRLSLLILVIFASAGSITAAVCRVTKTADTNDGFCDSDCSLREAVATSSCDTVIFPGQLFHQFGTTIGLTGSEIRIDHPISIIGTGADRLSISGNNQSRVFFVNAAASISGLTLTGGNGVGAGVSGLGGAVLSSAGNSLTLDTVHVTGNTATIDGGGVHLLTGSHTIRNSTFSAHTGGLGSAIRIQGGSLALVNSTIANNPSGNGFGALSIFSATVTVRNCTIKGNLPGYSILLENSANLSFGNSIIDTIANDACIFDTFAESAGNNLMTERTFCDISVRYQPSDIFDSNGLINPLSNNGGTIPTMGLPAGSRAIDAGNDQLALELPITFDQRGLRRIFDGNSDGTARIDIGAVEEGQSQPPSGSVIKGRIFGANGRPISGAIVTSNYVDSDFTQVGITNPFGYYYIFGPAGGYRTLTVKSKRASFASFTLGVFQNRENINFFAQ